MNFPLKKRRGRPPKYLSVWQRQQNNNNGITEYNNNNSCTMNNICDVDIGQVIDMSKNRAESDGQVKDDNKSHNNDADDDDNNNNNNTGSNDGQEYNNMGEIRGSDNRGVKDIQDMVRSPGDATDTRAPQGQRHEDRCPGSAPGDNTDSAPEIRKPNSDNIRQQTATPSESSPHLPSSAFSDSSHSDRSSARNRDLCVAKLDQNHERRPVNQTASSGREFRESEVKQPASKTGSPAESTDVTSLVAESRQPMKRRPGRPPGSTKKARAVFPPFLAKPGNEDEFSLRRFFEAGGRDYHDYLEWLKTKRTTVPSPPQMPLIVPPFCQLPMAGSNVRMTTQGFAFPAAPVYRPPVPLLAGVRPVVTAVVTPVTSQPAATNQEETICSMSAAAPAHANFIAQQASFDYKCFTCKPNAPVVDPPKRAPRSEACALDLSAKRKCSDSDSEKENDCLDMSVNKRQKHDKGLSARKAPPPSVLSGDKQNPEIDGRHATDDLVESSTESDVTTSWSVDQVANFVARVPECHVYAEAFRSHRIDGTTLPHLSDDHLLNHVGMKLGHMIHLRLALSRLKSEKL